MAAGIREVVVFHAPDEELRPHVADLPFAVIADPAPSACTPSSGLSRPSARCWDLRAWPAIAGGILNSLWGIVRHRRPIPALNPHGGRFGLPADFLIGSHGRILAVKYGRTPRPLASRRGASALASRERRPARRHQPVPADKAARGSDGETA